MGKISVSMYLSLDGVMEHPVWTMPYWNHELAAFQSQVLEPCDALLLGRATYENMSEAWPNYSVNEEPDVHKMNSMRKFVPTATLDKTKWNATFIKDNFIETVTALKRDQDLQLLIYGSRQMIGALADHHLIDEFHLIVCPIVLGKGQRLYSEHKPGNWTLARVKSTETGVVILTYQASAMS